MKFKHVLLCASSLVIACAGAEFPEENYLKRQQNEALYLNLHAEAEKGNEQACYSLANYYYFGKQFIAEPEKMKASYYKEKDGKSRVYYKLGKVEVEREAYEKAFRFYEQG